LVEHNRPIENLPTPSRTGYDPIGWWTLSNGGTEISSSTIITNNATYYAHWSIKQYMAIFNANGGSGGTIKT
jgi:uncharacterized repeat protein (TIGR02543 family)